MKKKLNAEKRIDLPASSNGDDFIRIMDNRNEDEVVRLQLLTFDSDKCTSY